MTVIAKLSDYSYFCNYIFYSMKMRQMGFPKSTQNRYTTKRYNNVKKIDEKQIEELKEILCLSPSSINSQPWKFTFVSNESTKKQLSEVSWLNKNKVLQCDTVVVFSRIDNISLFEQQIETELPAGAVNYLKNSSSPCLKNKSKRGLVDRSI